MSAQAAGCRGWKMLYGVTRPAIHIRCVSSTEAGSRPSEDEQLWETVALLPFSAARLGSFFQDRPVLKNPFLEDALLRGYLRRHLPQEAVFSDLRAFGNRVAAEVDGWGRECEVTPPRLVHFDPWGRRVDHILTSPAWKRMKELSAQEGLVAIAYERPMGEWSRVYQMCKLYIFSPSSGLYTCPLAMTDGAAKVIQSTGVSWPVEAAYNRLTSRQPEHFWTSGQWMTERQGGSDVGSGTATMAVPQSDGWYKLYGFKWFTSATDADMTLTLARVCDRSGATIPGSRGLSLFYAEVSRDHDGCLRGIEVQRLKDKLGTRQMPTAELLLDGLPAHRLSEEGRGVASIANMLTITRIHNSIAAAASMRRVVQLARDYATRRTAFGKLLKEHPLHMQTLARMEVETRGAFLLVMDVCRLLGREESGIASQFDTHLLRLLTPVVKLYTGKQTVAVVSEGLESFGGQGYMEDTGLPGLLRDAQVLSIWEGTTNVLSLDVLRCVHRSSGMVLHAYFTHAKSLLAGASSVSSLDPAVRAVDGALSELKGFVQEAATKAPGYLELAARDLAYSLARIYAGALLIDHASWKGSSPADIYAALRWCEQDLCIVASNKTRGCYDGNCPGLDSALVYEQATEGEN
ncbi:acyl-CoA dehydrogenase family member 11-like [Syngnathus acus]|uniref:acyl-CoA dehydrogenase family member 11-like n=1 Tax=Syngnathus acus TaxID=161584 RepID=UPI0018863B02|nr:acyl-CoA dehydrogenase family member 11-like [Syngnathus acus]XP_037114116.1 acyl-CoA dehydrogenase family member 11-like [Syngnathus acus]XP_037114117.1 acyl-CoA dehydrogenase family member 11-like [Syngnathus acus]XP_037114118.1 acyl-CoA dehydrogenase family member 11-like [Syngnathus acus]